MYAITMQLIIITSIQMYSRCYFFLTLVQIIDSDLHNPHGLAVDWVSNNIYFSHTRAENLGRIEVAKCDGSHRKVLIHNLRKVGVLAVNPFTG